MQTKDIFTLACTRIPRRHGCTKTRRRRYLFSCAAHKGSVFKGGQQNCCRGTSRPVAVDSVAEEAIRLSLDNLSLDFQ